MLSLRLNEGSRSHIQKSSESPVSDMTKSSIQRDLSVSMYGHRMRCQVTFAIAQVSVMMIIQWVGMFHSNT